jgi:hypothetical protein
MNDGMKALSSVSDTEVIPELVVSAGSEPSHTIEKGRDA